MSQSGEKHAQDYNLIWCILMALRVIYFPAVIYGDPVVGAFSVMTNLRVDLRFKLYGSCNFGAKLPLSCLQLGLLMTSRNIEYFSNIQHLKNILSLKFRVMLLNSKNICQYVIFQSGQDTVVPFTPIRWSYFQNLSLPFYCEWEANCLNVQNERN